MVAGLAGRDRERGDGDVELDDRLCEPRSYRPRHRRSRRQRFGADSAGGHHHVYPYGYGRLRHDQRNGHGSGQPTSRATAGEFLRQILRRFDPARCGVGTARPQTLFTRHRTGGKCPGSGAAVRGGGDPRPSGIRNGLHRRRGTLQSAGRGRRHPDSILPESGVDPGAAPGLCRLERYRRGRDRAHDAGRFGSYYDRLRRQRLQRKDSSKHGNRRQRRPARLHPGVLRRQPRLSGG